MRKRNELGSIAGGLLDRVKALVRFDLNFFYELVRKPLEVIEAIPAIIEKIPPALLETSPYASDGRGSAARA
jgi:hypothetical protein